MKKRQATLYDQGTTRFDVTNIATVGKSVSGILSAADKFQNERIYISGVAVTQLEIFEEMKRATATNDNDWDVSHRTAESLRDEGFAKIAKNDFSGILDVIGASLFQEGTGSYYSGFETLANEQLGVKDDLSKTVKKYVDGI